MSMIDLTAPTPAVIPAVEAKEYPIKYARKILLEGTPQAMRAYVELQPYRRILGQVLVTPAQPILDGEGNPVLDGDGMPTFTAPVYVEGVVAEELKTPEVDGDIVVLDVANILPAPQTPEQAALVQSTLLGYLNAGGDLKALTMAGIVLMVKSEGIAQGKLKVGE